METETLLSQAEQLVSPWAKASHRPESNRLDVIIEREDLPAAAKALTDARWGYLSAITGLDMPAPAAAEGAHHPENQLESLCHFCEGAAVLTLRVRVPYSDPHIPSLCGIIPSATLYERELMELFGVIVDNTPVTDRLILSDDWPVGVFPLRKSFTGLSSEEGLPSSEAGTEEK